jgi:hypothetical protein
MHDAYSRDAGGAANRIVDTRFAFQPFEADSRGSEAIIALKIRLTRFRQV